MTRRRGGAGGRARWSAGVAAALLGIVCSGCAVLGTGAEKRRAQELADRVYPGLLTVVGARGLFPQTSGAEVTFALADDPDAVARLRIDASQNRCDGGATCEEALRAAVGAARADADWLRTATAAFAECGHRVLALDEQLTQPWIEARVTNDTVDRVLAEAGECARRWAAARAGQPRADRLTTVTVRFASPETVRKLPDAKGGTPGLLRATDARRLAALAGTRHISATYRTAGDPAPAPADGPARDDGAGATVTADVTMPFDERMAFARNVGDAVLPLLRATHPEAVLAPSPVMGVWSLIPGDVGRVRGHVLFCERPPAGGAACHPDRSVGVTADLSGGNVTDLRIHTGIRDGLGVLRLPPA